MAHYITSAMLSDKALKDLCTEEYLTLVDADLESLAADHGVDVDEIEIAPLDHRLKELVKCMLYIRICLDHGAINPQAAAVGVEIDIYENKRKAYEKQASDLRSRITAEVFTGEADTPQERIASYPMDRA